MTFWDFVQNNLEGLAAWSIIMAIIMGVMLVNIVHGVRGPR